MTFDEYFDEMMQQNDGEHICPFDGKKCRNVDQQICYQCATAIIEYIVRYRTENYNEHYT